MSYNPGGCVDVCTQQLLALLPSHLLDLYSYNLRFPAFLITILDSPLFYI